MQDAVHGTGDVDERADVVADELQAAVVLEVGEVGGRSRDQVVHADHGVPEREQPVAEVAAEEPGRAGYEEAHARRRPILS